MLIWVPVNLDDLFTPTIYYSPSLPLGLPSSQNVCIFGIDVALLASISRLKVSEVFPKMLKGEVY